MAIGKDLIEKIFPIELVGYFEITDYQELCSMQDKLEFIIVDFVERNELPNGFSFEDYEKKISYHRKLFKIFLYKTKVFIC